MKFILLGSAMFLIPVFIFAQIKTQDLGSVKKENSAAKEEPKIEVAYDKLKTNIPIKDKSAATINDNNASKQALFEDKKVPEEEMHEDKAKGGETFYRKLGDITIRASEEYVYIRAGKSALIMDSQGKILIDSDGDLIIKSSNDLVLSAKRDLIFKAGGKIKQPEKSGAEGEKKEELPQKE